MQWQENISLQQFNTFGIKAHARYFARFQSVDQLARLLEAGKALGGEKEPLVLGGGSNILLKGDYNGPVLKNEIPGIEVVGEDDAFTYVRVGAGEHWHRFVMDCIAHNRAGVENLSLIPGSTGASPMQNIGAYGVELQDVFHTLQAYHIRDKAMTEFSKTDCAFGYRESVFKNKYRNQFVILTVTYKLKKKPDFNTSYGAITQELERMGVQELSIKAISDAVIRIRSSKLPNPAEIGNAGSFFKNPTVPKAKFDALKELFPGVVGYPQGEAEVKLAAGWLIEQCGWKGFRRGDAGCYPRQALVLVNYGNAGGEEILQLSQDIQASVREKFSVDLEREVNLV